VFGAGFLLGPVRVLALEPRIGVRAAEGVEAPFMATAILLAARWVVKHFGLGTRVERLGAGVLALALVLVAEAGLVGVVRGMAPGEYVASRDPVAGGVHVALLLLQAAAPLLVGRRPSRVGPPAAREAPLPRGPAPMPDEAAWARGLPIRVGVGGAGDLTDVVELLESAALWLARAGIRQWEPGAARAERARLAGWVREEGLLVARAGVRLAGACFAVAEPTPEWQGRPGRALYVHRLVVARTHAGTGVPARLLAACDARALAAGVPALRLDCWDGNHRLRELYRGLGFDELEAVEVLGYRVRLFQREAT